jgi:hypothetical protein
MSTDASDVFEICFAFRSFRGTSRFAPVGQGRPSARRSAASGADGGAETFTDIARFGEKKLPLLQRFRPFANGTAMHDQLGGIVAALDPGAFECLFTAWVAHLSAFPKGLSP